MADTSISAIINGFNSWSSDRMNRKPTPQDYEAYLDDVHRLEVFTELLTLLDTEQGTTIEDVRSFLETTL